MDNHLLKSTPHGLIKILTLGSLPSENSIPSDFSGQTLNTAKKVRYDKKRRFKEVSRSVLYYAFGNMIYINEWKSKLLIYYLWFTIYYFYGFSTKTACSWKQKWKKLKYFLLNINKTLTLKTASTILWIFDSNAQVGPIIEALLFASGEKWISELEN